MKIPVQKYSFGVLTVAASLILWVAFIGCSKKSSGNMAANPSDSTFNLRMLSLGDSYTIGESVAEADRFPNQTIQLLKVKGINLVYPAQIIARTGWTTANLLSGIQTATPPPTGNYDVVTLLIGVNNQYQGLSLSGYRTQFTDCLNKAIEYSGNRVKRVFVVSIPDYGATPFGASNAEKIGREIDQFNAAAKDITLAKGVSFTDITPGSRQAVSDRSLVAGDGLHPSGKEYAKWAGMLAAGMAEVLK